MFTARLHCVCFAALALVVAACSSSSDKSSADPQQEETPAEGNPEGAKECGLSSSSASCNSCLQGSCCDTAAACAANSECVALLKCVSACSTDSCVQGCGSQHQSAVSTYNTFIGCMNDSCTSACSGGSSGNGGSGGGSSSCLSAGQTCGGSTKCCSGNLCVDFEGGNTQCTPLCSSGSDCGTGCCAETNSGTKVCAPSSFCGSGGSGGGTSNDACDSCLSSCHGMSSCCTGYGCICYDECTLSQPCSPGTEMCCSSYGDCMCMSNCPY